MIGELVIAPPMTEAEAAAWVTADEQRQAQTFGCSRRRREFLTWRALVRQRLGEEVEIGYNAVGAPILVGQDLYLSVSHCAERIAVRFSDRPCAVDVEAIHRNFDRVRARYMTPSEQLLSADPLLPAAVWCAKEALYKYAGREGLELLHDLRILHVDFGSGTISGCIVNQPPILLSMRCEDDFMIVYI